MRDPILALEKCAVPAGTKAQATQAQRSIVWFSEGLGIKGICINYLLLVQFFNKANTGHAAPAFPHPPGGGKSRGNPGSIPLQKMGTLAVNRQISSRSFDG